VLDKILDKLSWIIAYMCLPITYPIHYFRMKELDKKIANERKEREAHL
jgi:tRNA A-37 threonylcarbamoyl transferase component Bud32